MSNRPSRGNYERILKEVVDLLELARRTSSRSVNAIMTATYWEIGRKIVKLEQGGLRRAGYGKELIPRLSVDLTARFGRGFGLRNLAQMRAFYIVFSKKGILQTVSAKSSRPQFPLSWSHYVKLLSVENPSAREFYHQEALRAGWSVRQLDRQISSLFFERTAMSKNKVAMLTHAATPHKGDALSPEEELKDPYVLEFLGLKDEYSEADLEDALTQRLETFLLELGSDFAFIGRQRRLRVGDTWYRVDLVFFHRLLRCLIIIDLKLGEFTHADAGQMHLYLNYAKAHWTRDGENPPVGLILCAERNDAVAKYALEGLPNKVLAAKYRTTLPREKVLVAEIQRTQKLLEHGSSKIKRRK